MKKSEFWRALLACFGLCSLLAPTAAAAGQFQDVPADAYYKDAVDWAVTRGITDGTTATTFSPNASCTRAQMVTFLWRMNGSPVVQNKTVPFVDVAPTSYYYNAVLWATTQGITEGTDDTHFSPNETVTRAQAVTMLWRADGSPTGASRLCRMSRQTPTTPTRWRGRRSRASPPARTRSTFAPNDPCTRAQIVTFLYRYSCGSGSVLTTTKYPVILVHGLLGWGEYDDINGVHPVLGHDRHTHH